MAMKRCPVCGEKYSDTYRSCPFCEEEEALSQGDRIRRSGRGGKRVSRQQPNLLSPILIVLILVMACLLVYLLFGDKIMEKLNKDETPTPPVSEEIEAKPPVVDGSGTSDDGTEDPDDTQEPVSENTDMDYEKASQLPAGLTLSTTDFSLFTAGETHTIKVSGGNGTYQWFSQDEGVASVDDSGTVTAVSKGDINIVVTDGEKQGTCIVRVRASGTTAPSATTPSTGTGTQSGSLKAGSAVVVNGGNGVRVRSGPGTNYEVLASVPNGGSVQIVESAGDGWYKITFSGTGGAATTGYMKGDYLANN